MSQKPDKRKPKPWYTRSMNTVNRSRALALPALVPVLILVAITAAGAQQSRIYTLESLCGKTVAGTLSSIGRVVSVGYKGEPELLPNHPASQAVEASIMRARPGILVETLFVLRRPRPDNPAEAQAELATIYGHLRSIGSLQGIQYWSASRNTMRTFYAESWLIDGPSTKNRLPDPPHPKPDAIPSTEEFFAYQRDLSFGANQYHYSYSYQGDAFTVVQTNLTKMNYGIVPVMAAGALSTHLLIIRVQDAILFYAESGASAPGIFKSRLEVSFSNRAEALFRWFESKLGK